MNKPVAYVNSMCSDYIDWKVDPMSIDGQSLYTTPQTKPLSDEEIMDIAEQSDYSPREIEMGYDYEIRIARAIEERHGIK